MTPAIVLLQKKKVPHQVHEYEHDPNHASYGLEAAEKLGVDPAIVFKTLVAELDNGKLVVAIIPVAEKLNLKSLAKAAGAKKAQMADPDKVARSSGYVMGGVSPLGQKKALPTILHQSAEPLDMIHVSAGRRGLEVGLAPTDLLMLTRGKFAAITNE